MKLKKLTIQELGTILKQEFDLELDSQSLSKLAYSLVGLFELMQKVENRHKFENRPAEVIDQNANKVLDKKEVK